MAENGYHATASTWSWSQRSTKRSQSIFWYLHRLKKGLHFSGVNAFLIKKPPDEMQLQSCKYKGFNQLRVWTNWSTGSMRTWERTCSRELTPTSQAASTTTWSTARDNTPQRIVWETQTQTSKELWWWQPNWISKNGISAKTTRKYFSSAWDTSKTHKATRPYKFKHRLIPQNIHIFTFYLNYVVNSIITLLHNDAGSHSK